MTKIASVKVGNSGKSLWFDSNDLELHVGDKLVVETARGLELGVLDKEIFEASDSQIKELNSELKPVKRVASDSDIRRSKEMQKRGHDAIDKFRELAAQTNEQMTPISVEYLLDGRKAIFYFSAPERQDFRDLVKKLSREFHLRVDMRQINEREKSALVSGIGSCGQELCCARLGYCPNHVSIKQAKAQGLSLNPENISGMCGKLLCCLDYEFEDYQEFNSRAPKLKAKILTPDGEAVVTDINMPREWVEVKLSENDKRVKIPLEDMEIDKSFARQVAGSEPENIRPNKISKKAWQKATSETTQISLQSVYTSTSLQGSEKLATGVVKTLPGVKRREAKTVSTKNNNKNKNKSFNKNRNRNRQNNNAKRQNVYENNSSAKVRRRSRKLDSTAVRPGQNTSGIRNK